MPKEIKLTENEVSQLNEVNTTYNNLQAAFGQLHVQKLTIAEQEAAASTAWTENRKKEQEAVNAIVKSYGPGTLNLKEGTFTPLKDKDEPEVVEGNFQVV